MNRVYNLMVWTGRVLKLVTEIISTRITIWRLRWVRFRFTQKVKASNRKLDHAFDGMIKQFSKEIAKEFSE